MEERAGERRWPPLSSVLSPLLRRGARKKNPRCEKSSRLATISTDTDRLQVCATNGAAACFGGSIKIRPLRAAAQSLLSQGWELPDNFGRIEKNFRFRNRCRAGEFRGGASDVAQPRPAIRRQAGRLLGRATASRQSQSAAGSS